jgi:hypothetical protein
MGRHLAIGHTVPDPERSPREVPASDGAEAPAPSRAVPAGGSAADDR